MSGQTTADGPTVRKLAQRLTAEHGEPLVTAERIRYWRSALIGQLARETERAGEQFVGWPVTNVSRWQSCTYVDVQVETVSLDHVNLSQSGAGACICGAQPGPGEYIPGWWADHANLTGSEPGTGDH